MHLAQHMRSVVDSYERGNEPSDSIKGDEFLTSRVTISFSSRTLLLGLS
jgi:hypothetical protein